MAFHLPEFVDELIDTSSDPLCVLLAREGEYEEAYQTAMYHRAGQQQIVTRCEIEQRPYEDDDYEQLQIERQSKRRIISSKKRTFN